MQNDSLITNKEKAADYSEGENYSGENFNNMSPKDKEDHIKEMWQLCFVKAFGAAKIISIFNKMSERLNKYGSKFNLNVDTNNNLKIKILR